MKKSINLSQIASGGIQFTNVDYLIEIFPSPIPTTITSEISDIPIDSESDLFRMSIHEGFDELFLPSSEFVLSKSNGQNYQITRFDFLRWQLERFSNQTLYHLINKTCCNIIQFLDEEAEYAKDPDYHPEGWLDPGFDEEGYYEKGLRFIERVKIEAADNFYLALIESILDEDFGILTNLETEIDGNLDEIRDLYADWTVPLMIIWEGKFFPYIESDFDHNLMMDDYTLQRTHVRNYDEGEIAN